jgi:hypothetical protein
MTLSKKSFYRKLAEKMLVQANQAQAAATRKIYLDLAAIWMEMAEAAKTGDPLENE